MKAPSNKLLHTLVAVILILLVTSGIGLVSYREQRELDKANLQQATEESAQAARQADQHEVEATRLARLAEIEEQEADKARAEATAARREAEQKRAEAARAMEAAEKAEAKARQYEAEVLRQQSVNEQQTRRKKVSRGDSGMAGKPGGHGCEDL